MWGGDKLVHNMDYAEEGGGGCVSSLSTRAGDVDQCAARGGEKVEWSIWMPEEQEGFPEAGEEGEEGFGGW